jgi:hypothetical protein
MVPAAGKPSRHQRRLPLDATDMARQIATDHAEGVTRNDSNAHVNSSRSSVRRARLTDSVAVSSGEL